MIMVAICSPSPLLLMATNESYPALTLRIDVTCDLNSFIFNQSINQSINQSKLVTPRRRWGTPTDASAVTTAHRRLSSATRSIDDIDRPVHSLMLSFHDLRGLLRSPVVWSTVAYHGDRHGQNMITCDAWRLTSIRQISWKVWEKS